MVEGDLLSMKKNTIGFELGEILMIYRKRAHLSMSDVAKCLDVTPATISNYEASKTTISYRKMLGFKKVLGEGFGDMLKVIEEGGCFKGHIY